MTEAAKKQRDIIPSTRDLSEKTRRYKGRFRRALDQVFVDEFEKDNNLSEIINNLLGDDSTKYERVVAALQIINRISPKVVNQALQDRLQYTQVGIPFKSEDYELKTKIGHGGVNDVFLLVSKREEHPSFVLKVNMLSRGNRNLTTIQALARGQKEEYERISAVYKDIPDLIPQEHYIIMHGPRKERYVVAMIQPYLGTGLRDIFADFGEDELQELLTRNGELSKQLSMFVEATKKDKSLIENELDLLGHNNLIITGRKGNERLLLLDPHFRSVDSRETIMQQEIRNRLDYLDNLTENIK